MTYDEAIQRSSPRLRVCLQRSVEILRRAEIIATRYDAENGFWLGFSGGKDSQALYHVAVLAGVKFKAHFSPTTVDPPQVIRFIRKQYPDVEFGKVTQSIYQMAVKKKILPTRTLRWCCAEFKEKGGAGTVTLVGVRHQESSRRAKRQEVGTASQKFNGTLDEFFSFQEQEIQRKLKHINIDQWSIDQQHIVSCISGKDKIIVSPIIDWSDADVWEFLNDVLQVPHCELYDPPYNQHRIGCILCPMANKKQKLRDCELFPYVKRKWLNTIDLLIGVGYLSDAQKFYQHQVSHEDFVQAMFDWWVDGRSWAEFISDYTHPKLFDL